MSQIQEFKIFTDWLEASFQYQLKPSLFVFFLQNWTKTFIRGAA